MFACKICQKTYTKWQGKCDSCQTWGSLEESSFSSNLSSRAKTKRKNNKESVSITPLKLHELDEDNNVANYLVSGIEEFDHTVGGRLVSGQVILLAGTPGIGKSTLCSQLTEAFSSQGKKILYICGEESPVQIKQRTKRLGFQQENVDYISEVDIAKIEAFLEFNSANYDLTIIDSIQTLFTSELNSSSGSVSQITECTNRLVTLAKGLNMTMLIIGHVTKAGDIAGPKILEHMVDTVLYFEGEKRMELRILRVEKNRFGPTDEVGIFKMEASGLKQVTDTKELFDPNIEEAAGSVFSMAIEGNRPVVVEVQALATKSYFPQPRRTASGFDFNRMNILIAVIEKILKINMGEYDVYVNITGGMKIVDSGLDLAVISAILSSVKNRAIPRSSIFFGEVGLTGEIRKIWLEDKRIKEAKRLGFKSLVSRDIGNVRNIKF